MAAGVIFGRMAAIYRHRWTSHPGSLDQAFIEWESMLVNARLPAGILSAAIDRCREQLEWPPAPAQFISIARAVADPSTPPLETAIRLLIRAAHLHLHAASLAETYQHPLVLAVASAHGYNVAIVRTGSLRAVEDHICPIYGQLIESGWPDWPAHAWDRPRRVAHPVDHAAGLAAIRDRRGQFSWLGGGIK
ncbi:hypothetical protein [Methylomicrobium lacus]|uniref:hypothetical protein n=1 Tax=Methylomicrobium lacus TaxID=136992 RepID=UPI00045EB371|nr:hypothetical protein [Methylomicrobium lacus]